MITVRQIITNYLMTEFAKTVTGSNGKTAQYQGRDDDKLWFGLYREDGYWESETSDINEALDYIGL